MPPVLSRPAARTELTVSSMEASSLADLSLVQDPWSLPFTFLFLLADGIHVILLVEFRMSFIWERSGTKVPLKITAADSLQSLRGHRCKLFCHLNWLCASPDHPIDVWTPPAMRNFVAAKCDAYPGNAAWHLYGFSLVLILLHIVVLLQIWWLCSTWI